MSLAADEHGKFDVVRIISSLVARYIITTTTKEGRKEGLTPLQMSAFGAGVAPFVQRPELSPPVLLSYIKHKVMRF